MVSRLFKTRALSFFFFGLLLTGFTLNANAQLGLVPKVRLKAGLFMPQGSGLKSVSDGTWLKFGGDISLPLGIPFVGGGSRLGIDYMESHGSRIVPITLTQIIQPSAVVARNPLYGGTGIGLWNGRVAGQGSGTALGLRFLVGANISTNLFIEAQYDTVGKIAGTRVDGFSILAGTKF